MQRLFYHSTTKPCFTTLADFAKENFRVIHSDSSIYETVALAVLVNIAATEEFAVYFKKIFGVDKEIDRVAIESALCSDYKGDDLNLLNLKSLLKERWKKTVNEKASEIFGFFDGYQINDVYLLQVMSTLLHVQIIFFTEEKDCHVRQVFGTHYQKSIGIMKTEKWDCYRFLSKENL